MDEAEMPPTSWDNTRLALGHISGALLHEDDAPGGCFAPPETAGAEESALGKTDGGGSGGLSSVPRRDAPALKPAAKGNQF